MNKLLTSIYNKYQVPEFITFLHGEKNLATQRLYIAKLLRANYDWRKAFNYQDKEGSYISFDGLDDDNSDRILVGGSIGERVEEDKKEQQGAEKLVNEPTIDKFEQYGHIGVMGPTESGKTSIIKTFFCDNKFPNIYQEFIYCGPPKQLNEMAKAFAAWKYLNKEDYAKAKMTYFKLEEMQQAIIYAQTENSQVQKLFYIDDAMIISEANNKKIATFIHQAKNYNVTMIVAMHEPFGNANEKMIRSGCRYFVVINLPRETLARLFKIPSDHFIIKQIENVSSPHERVIIEDKVKQTFFNKQYSTFNKVNKD